MAVRPQMKIVRKRVNGVRTLRQGSSVTRANGNVYDAPIHKHDYGPAGLQSLEPLNEPIPVLPGSYRTYRHMDRSPFIAMAKEFKLGPVRNAVGTWKTKNDQVPDGRLQFVQDTLEPHIAGLISSLSDGLSMGNSPNQIIMDMELKSIPGVPTAHPIIREIRPLNHDTTSVRVSETDRYKFLGLATEDGDLDPSEVVYWRYDPRPYDGYWWFGRCLHENHRREFAEYDEDRQFLHRFAKKLSGVVAIVKIVKGLARDANGHQLDRFEAAKNIANSLAYSMGAVFETVGVTEDEIKRNPKLAEITDIMVDALDLGSSAAGYGLILSKRQQSQRECVMGYLTPPPSIMDVQTGGKADTETKTDTGLTQSEVVGMMIHEPINKQLVNPFIMQLWGPEAKDTIYRAPTKFTEDQRLASDRVMSAIVNQPIAFQAALAVMDLAQVMRNTNTPVRENLDSVDISKEMERLQALNKPVAPTPPTKPIAVKGGTRTKQGKNRGINAK